MADTSVGEATWHLSLELREIEGHTTLTFAQLLGDDDMSNVGPGWEYYLDRLSRVMAGEDATNVQWDEYFPAMGEYYSNLAAEG